jgi:hypothetical protein
MKEKASDNTIRMFHEFMAIAEGQPLQDVKDAVCNMLASIIVGQPDIRTVDRAQRHVDFCAKDIKTAVRANWDHRKLHEVAH